MKQARPKHRGVAVKIEGEMPFCLSILFIFGNPKRKEYRRANLRLLKSDLALVRRVRG
jgi:hypothetical protein